MLESHQTHTNPHEYIQCRICGYRAKEIAKHVATHGIDPKDYGVTKCHQSIKRMLGDNNPAWNHGGRLSPFSDRFKRYEEGAGYTKEDVLSKKRKTVEENPQNRSNRLEYWIARGMTEQEAKEALSARQSTFSLEKCISKYGKERGFELWKNRQTKWLNTMSSKTEEERALINQRKSSRINYRSLWGSDLNSDGIFYIVERQGNLKIGITTKSISKRWLRESVDVLFQHTATINECFKIEQLLKTDVTLKPFKETSGGYEGWTETFVGLPLEMLLDKTKYYISNFEEQFRLRYPAHAS